MKNRISPFVVAGAVFSLCLPGFTQAQPVFQQTLAIGGTELITLRGKTKEEVATRADIIYSRLVWILADSTLSRRDIWIKLKNHDPSIYVKDRLLITVMPQDSAYNQTTMQKQAQIWRMRFSETLPILKSVNPPTKP